jgi:hypothetical protein
MPVLGAVVLGCVVFIIFIVWLLWAAWSRSSWLIRITLLTTVIWMLSIANLAVRQAVSELAGGTASQGRVVNGTCYVGANGHYRKVSAHTYAVLREYEITSGPVVLFATAVAVTMLGVSYVAYRLRRVLTLSGSGPNHVRPIRGSLPSDGALPQCLSMKRPLEYSSPNEHRMIRVAEVSERDLTIYLGPEGTRGSTEIGKGKRILFPLAIALVIAATLMYAGVARVGGMGLARVAWICGAMWAVVVGLGIAVHLFCGAVWRGQMVLTVLGNRAQLCRVLGSKSVFVLAEGELQGVEVLPERSGSGTCMRLTVGVCRPIEICHGCSTDDVERVAGILTSRVVGRVPK